MVVRLDVELTLGCSNSMFEDVCHIRSFTRRSGGVITVVPLSLVMLQDLLPIPCQLGWTILRRIYLSPKGSLCLAKSSPRAFLRQVGRNIPALRT